MEQNTARERHAIACQNYNMSYNTGCMTTCKIEDKLELFRLVCFLYINLNKKDSEKYSNCMDVLSAVFKTDITKPYIISNGEKKIDHVLKFIWTVAIICDDLCYMNNGIMENPGYENSAELIKRIKILIQQFIPF